MLDEATERCRIRWIVDIEAEASLCRFEQWLALLPAPDQTHVRSFVQSIDQQRALISRLLQRSCVCTALGLRWVDVELALTKGRKPFTINAKPVYAPNFNFNVSHEGRYVALAADPLYLVGVDVAAPRQSRPGAGATFGPGKCPLELYLQSFRCQLAASEWSLLERLTPDEHLCEAAFQRLWSLKEAFIKARGDGLGFQPLSRAMFQFPGGDPLAASAQLVLDGEPQSRWCFHMEQLPHGHCVSVALGPAAAAIDELGVFGGTLKDQRVAPDSNVRRQEFTYIKLDSLLPTD